jgi:hypothetical protein
MCHLGLKQETQSFHWQILYEGTFAGKNNIRLDIRGTDHETKSTKCFLYQGNLVPIPAKTQSDLEENNPAREIYLLSQSGSHISLEVTRSDAVLEFH